MRCWTAIALILTCGLSALAQDDRALFDEGRRLADQGKDARANFARVAARLEQHAAVYPSPEAFLNLGNAAFLADDAPRAIWAFRRGLALAPQHRRLREHLEYARAQVALPGQQREQAEPDPWPMWLPRWTGCVWLTLTAGAYTAACAAGAVWLIVHRRAWLVAAGCTLVLSGLAGWAWSIGALATHRDKETPVVVIKAEGAMLHTGNGPSYPPHADLPTLSAGMEARRFFERGGWLQIQFAGGEIGWVPRERVLNAD
jgi:hypothetical protein